MDLLQKFQQDRWWHFLWNFFRALARKKVNSFVMRMCVYILEISWIAYTEKFYYPKFYPNNKHAQANEALPGRLGSSNPHNQWHIEIKVVIDVIIFLKIHLSRSISQEPIITAGWLTTRWKRLLNTFPMHIQQYFYL